ARSTRRAAGRGGGRLPSEPLAALAHPADPRAVRVGACARRGSGLSDPKLVVRRGYDAIAAPYDKWASAFEAPELGWAHALWSRLDLGSDVLDLGCGGGRTPAQRLAASHRYTGVDLSEAQIARARERIPHGRFAVGDATLVELEPAPFDAVVSLFMFGHIPR